MGLFIILTSFFQLKLYVKWEEQDKDGKDVFCIEVPAVIQWNKVAECTIIHSWRQDPKISWQHKKKFVNWNDTNDILYLSVFSPGIELQV